MTTDHAIWLRTAMVAHGKISGLRDNANNSCRWLEIAKIDTPRMTLGLAENGNWVRSIDEKIVEFVPGGYLLLLLPCLELQPDEFFRALRDAVTQLGHPVMVVDTFPVDSLLDTALCSAIDNSSLHWLSLGLDWIERAGTKSSLVKERLREIGMSRIKRIPQQLRHRALRLSKRV